MKWVYKMSELSVDGWKEYTLNHSIERSDVKYLIVAVMAVKILVKEKKDWDGDGEYWLTKIPGVGEKVVAIRPGPNPYGGAYLVSPVELPWLNKLAAAVYHD